MKKKTHKEDECSFPIYCKECNESIPTCEVKEHPENCKQQKIDNMVLFIRQIEVPLAKWALENNTFNEKQAKEFLNNIINNSGEDYM